MSRRRERLIVEQQRRWRGKSSVGAPFGRVRVRSEPFSFSTKRKKYEQRRRCHVFVRRIRRDQSNPNHVRGDFSVRKIYRRWVAGERVDKYGVCESVERRR